MTSLLRKISLQLLLALFALLVVELGVRLFMPEIKTTTTDSVLFTDDLETGTRKLSPGAVGNSRGYTFEVDGHGFWKYSSPSPDAAERVLLIGDSVTMGIGVPPDSTVGGRLAEKVKVYNPSAIGFDSNNYRIIIDRLIDSIDDDGPPPFDRVVILWCLNDIYESEVRLGMGYGGFLSRAMSVVRRNYMTYHWLKAIAMDRPKVYYEHDRQYYVNTNEVPIPIQRLERISTSLSEHDIEHDIVVVPYEYQLRINDRTPQEIFIAQASETINNIHDPFDVFLAQPDSRSLYLFGDGIHLSSHGHKLLASYIDATILRQPAKDTGTRN
ncbi:MAG: hypothetical protein HKN43_14620 [Rhodothermales bacterium]|nr:hypothetical protein [Rhodothermales bacterium]